MCDEFNPLEQEKKVVFLYDKIHGVEIYYNVV
jgi:hypothetical protein